MAGWYEFALSGANQTVEFNTVQMTSTSHFEVPVGTTAQRPGTPVAGDTRYNSSDDAFEVYSGATKGWVQLEGGASQLTDLSDVTAKTGSGTTVVMDTNPTINDELTVLGDGTNSLWVELDSNAANRSSRIRHYENGVYIAHVGTDLNGGVDYDVRCGNIVPFRHQTNGKTKFTAQDTQSITFSSVNSGGTGVISDGFTWDGTSGAISNDGPVFLEEQASADGDVAGYGQLWVKTATPNELWFTNDAGTDVQLGVGGSSPLTTKGDLYAYSTADARLPVGSNDKFLCADSTQATGMGWRNFSNFPAFGSTFSADDRLLLEDVTDNGIGYTTAGTLFATYGLPQAVEGTVVCKATGATDEIVFQEITTGDQQVIFSVQDSGGNPLFRVHGGGDGGDRTEIAPGDYLDLSGAPLRVDEITAPSTPATGTVYLYAKAGGGLYAKDDTGDEVELGATGWDYTAEHHLDALDIENRAFDNGGTNTFQAPTTAGELGLGDGIFPIVKMTGSPSNNSIVEFGIMLQIPTGYAPATHALTLEVYHRYTTNTHNGILVDAEAYKAVYPGQSAGSPLISASGTTVGSSWASKTWNVTDTGLAEGDFLMVVVTYAFNDTGGSNNGKIEIAHLGLIVS